MVPNAWIWSKENDILKFSSICISPKLNMSKKNQSHFLWPLLSSREFDKADLSHLSPVSHPNSYNRLSSDKVNEDLPLFQRVLSAVLAGWGLIMQPQLSSNMVQLSQTTEKSKLLNLIVWPLRASELQT